MKQREWEIKHGENIRERKIQRMESVIKKKSDRVIGNLGDDGRERLILATQRFLELAEKEAITVELGPK